MDKTKNYKNSFIKYLGCSDMASVVLRTPGALVPLDFGSDGAYTAYVIDKDAPIPHHYSLIHTLPGPWLWVYDDSECAARFAGALFKIYRAGDFGCIIQIL